MLNGDTRSPRWTAMCAVTLQLIVSTGKEIMADVRLLELRNTYKWGGGPDKTVLLSAEQHDRTLVDVVVAYIRDVRDTEFCITDKARARGLTFYEIAERGKFDLRVLRA